jgi:hypothetical protein
LHGQSFTDERVQQAEQLGHENNASIVQLFWIGRRGSGIENESAIGGKMEGLE